MLRPSFPPSIWRTTTIAPLGPAACALARKLGWGTVSAAAARGERLRELHAGEEERARRPRQALVPAVHAGRVEEVHAHRLEVVRQRLSVGLALDRTDGVEGELARVLHRRRLRLRAVEL